MEITEILFLALASYILGSIPFAYILPRLFGFGDIRKIGSGNVGSTNVLRTGNKFLAAIVLLCDITKGVIPFLYFENFFNFQETLSWKLTLSSTVYLISSLTILGHLFPIWLKFKGGKGVATYIGFLIGANYFLGIFFILSWLVVALISKYSSLSSIISLIITPLFAIYFFSFTTSLNYLLIVISLIIIFRHYSNIVRLLNKMENKIRF